MDEKNYYPQYPKKLSTKDSRLKGIVYLIHCEGSSYYKIGITSGDITTRLSGMQCNCPYPLKLVISTKTAGYECFEAELHSWLDELRIIGEWFVLSPQLLERLVYKIKHK